MTEATGQPPRRRLVFVNRFFHPDHSATSQMLSDLAFGLAASGHDVTVVTSQQLYEDPGAKLKPYETVDLVKIVRAPTTNFGRYNILGRLVDYATFYVSAAWSVSKLLRRGDIVVAKTEPPLLAVALAPIVAAHRASLVNWLQDVFPEVAQRVYGDSPASQGLYAVLRWLRNRSLRTATANVVLGRRMADCIEQLGVSRSSICEIPNWADHAIIHPQNQSGNSIRTDLGLEGAFVVGYSGNLGRAHEFETILGAIEILEQDRPGGKCTSQLPDQLPGQSSPKPVRWLFTGGGVLLRALQEQVSRRGLQTVQFCNYQPRERLAESLAAADVHLVVLRPEFEGLIVPSKYYGIAAAARPTIFIGAADGEIGRLIREDESGITVLPGRCRDLAAAIRNLANDPTLCQQLGDNALRASQNGHSLSHAMERWQFLLSKLPASAAPN